MIRSHYRIHVAVSLLLLMPTRTLQGQSASAGVHTARPRIKAAAHDLHNQELTVSWDSSTGQVYSLEVATSVCGPWQKVHGNRGNGSGMSCSRSTQDGGVKFYRLSTRNEDPDDYRICIPLSLRCVTVTNRTYTECVDSFMAYSGMTEEERDDAVEYLQSMGLVENGLDIARFAGCAMSSETAKPDLPWYTVTVLLPPQC